MKFNAINISLPIFMLLLLVPLSLPLGGVQGKGVDIVFLDIVSLFCFLYFLIYIKNKSIFEIQITKAVSVMFVIFYCMASVTAITESSIIPILSLIKYTKPFLSIFIGFFLSRKISLDVFWRASYLASAFIAIILLLSLDNPYQRWGDNIFGIGVYGFPNSSSQYYIILLMFLIGYIAKENITFLSRVFGYFFIGIIVLFITFSLSRSALAIMVIFFSVSLVMSKFKFKYILYLTALTLATTFVLTGDSVNNINISEYTKGIEARYDRTFASDDFSSGRIDIANEVFDLMELRPLFGYKFSSFSNYHEGHSTPHNQYLESIFKTGVIGFLLYYSIILKLYFNIIKKYNSIKKQRIIMKIKKASYNEYYYRLFIVVFILIMIGNLSQPNITYSQTGGVFMALLGYLSQLKTYQVPLK
jgi:O-antigen ligase